MTDNVTSHPSLQSYSDFMDANAQLMTEVYSDPKLTAAEKMKTFSIGVRNQVILSRDLATRRAELMRYGMKSSDELKSLSFNPMAQAA
ncbi:MAG: hypothetical protein KAX46_03050 [Chromatiaceae bacterium]|nr:hypothetical protein [Chromatiaceae bacterium]